MGAEQSSTALDAFSEAARQLQTTSTIDELLHQIVDISVAVVDNCDYAGVSTDRNGQLPSPVVSDQHVLAIDSLQYTIGNGPCVRAMRGDAPLVDTPDLEHDERFREFGEQAVAEGCRAVLAHRLYVDSQTLGSLNLYASRANAFTDDDRKRSVMFASVASLAVNAVRLEIDGEGLREAVRSRDAIGQAKGILMERRNLTADEAFAHLREQSQHRNVKLRELAQQLVDETTPQRS